MSRSPLAVALFRHFGVLAERSSGDTDAREFAARVSLTINASREKVWNALVNPKTIDDAVALEAKIRRRRPEIYAAYTVVRRQP